MQTRIAHHNHLPKPRRSLARGLLTRLACLAMLAAAFWLPFEVPAEAQAEDSAVISPPKEIVGEYYIRPPEPPKPETVKSLRDYTDYLLGKVYVAPEELYAPPMPGTEGHLHDQIAPRKAMPLLAGNVALVTGELEGLAVGLKDGRIFVFSEFPCKEMRMPDNAQPAIIAWGRQSRNLLAADQSREHVYRFNLERCQLRPSEILGARDRGIKDLVMSQEGAWMAFSDRQGEVWAGPPEGLIEPALRLGKTPVMIGFTPFQGMLVIVEDSGKVTLWGVRDKKEIRSFVIPGGPFDKAELVGHILYLTDAKGDEKGWKILVRGPERTDQPKKKLFVSDGKLFFSTGLTRWQKKTRLIAPELILSWSENAGAIRVRDLDKETRYYSYSDGAYLGQDEIKADDWTFAPPDTDGVWSLKGRKFRLADPVFQTGLQRLMCRYIDGKGFFLWWRSMPKPMEANPHPMSLPVRADIRDAQPLKWMDLEAGALP